MSDNSSFEFVENLLINFNNNDNKIRAQAESEFSNLIKQDPNQVIRVLLQFIQSSNHVYIRIQSLIQIKNYIFRIERMSETPTLTAETYSFLEKIFTNVLQDPGRDKREIDFIFVILNFTIPFIQQGLIPPDIVLIMHQLLNSQFDDKAISFFAEYVGSIKSIDQLPNELFLDLVNVIQNVSQSPSTRCASLSLIYSLITFNQELIELLCDFVPNIISSLPDNLIDTALNSFINFFMIQYEFIGKYLEKLVLCLFSIIKNTDFCDAAKISSLETITRMIDRSSSVRKIIEANINEFIQTLCVIFANPHDEFEQEESSPLYNAGCSLLENFVDIDDDSKNLVSTILKENLNKISTQAVSTMILYVPNVDFLEQIKILLRNDDNLIFQNAIESLDYLIHHNLRKILKLNKQFPNEIMEELFQLINQGKNGATLPLARMIEELPSLKKNSIQLNLAQELIQLAERIQTPETIRILAAISLIYPDLIRPIAFNYSLLSLGIIANGCHEDICYILMIAITKFAKIMDQESFSTLVGHLISLIQQNPEASTWLGIRIISKQIGKDFVQFLPLIIPHLLSVTNQEIEILIEEKESFDFFSNKEYSSIFDPGNNRMIGFRIQQLADITLALESLSDYALSVGELFEPYFNDTLKTALTNINNVYDMEIRIASVELLKNLSVAVNNHYIEIVQELINHLIEEPLIKPKAKISESLTSIIEMDKCPSEVKLIYFQSLPTLIRASLESLYQSVENDEFDVEEEDFLNLLWAFLIPLKNLYSMFPNQMLDIYNQISSLLKQLNEETLSLLIQFSLGLHIDFLIACPINIISNYQTIIEQIHMFVNSKDFDSRRMALFGIGRIYERLNLNAQALDEIMNILFEAATNEEALENESYYVGNDNALSSYSLLLKQRIPMGNSTESIAKFVSMFPAEDDIEEAKISYLYLFELFVQAETNLEIAPLIQEISAKLFEAFEIPSISQEIIDGIQEYISKLPNVPNYVANFLSQCSI